MDGAAKASKVDIRVQQTHFSTWPISGFKASLYFARVQGDSGHGAPFVLGLRLTLSRHAMRVD